MKKMIKACVLTVTMLVSASALAQTLPHMPSKKEADLCKNIVGGLCTAATTDAVKTAIQNKVAAERALLTVVAHELVAQLTAEQKVYVKNLVAQGQTLTTKLRTMSQSKAPNQQQMQAINFELTMFMQKLGPLFEEIKNNQASLPLVQLFMGGQPDVAEQIIDVLAAELA